MKKVLNIAVDIETLSKRSTAAIIGIAAKVFSLGNDIVVESAEFKVAVDATSCAMLGFDIDPSTVDWWSHRPKEVKSQFDYTMSISTCLYSFISFIDDVKKNNNAEVVRIWCQGTDFDIAILRNAFVAVYNEREEKTIPWEYKNVRDARTFVCEGIRLMFPEVEDVYSVIPPMEGWKKHDAMSDVNKLIHNVCWVEAKLRELITRKEDKNV